MRVLLTNDDGIHAPGIRAMLTALLDAPVDGRPRHGGPLSNRSPSAVTRAPRHAVLVVAPMTVQSATSHGVTFHEPLMIRDEPLEAGTTGIAVGGRPADCVKLALTTLWPEVFGEGSLPDLVVSGMNAGANCGINVIYSGTVAAALEAAFLGVPSIAVSMMLAKGTPNFALGAQWARQTIDLLVAGGLPKAHECLSVNIPPTDDLSLDAPLPPVHVCAMNTHGLVDKYERRVSPAGETYYWAAGYGLDFRGTEPGTDVDHLLKRHITVTPLKFDLTQHATLPAWASRVTNRALGST
ncbi:MAG: 5'/3'-nucleotidase SurE [Phycisphaerales bacterium]|jgi:5'-nucleotidase